ncbi:MAG: ABC transporter ATP-binding protein [Vicinamibacteraceae bacterium]|nr:ABC transporter ATP-binding protein [Vicinamibacteraceae bacterium]
MLEVERVEKTYPGGEAPVAAVRGVSLSVAAGELVALMGPSGCGKSTLLHVCGAMDTPTRGRVAIEGRDLSSLDDGALTRVRRERVGFVFQFFNLLPTLTVAENIALPLLLSGGSPGEALERAAALANRVGLGHRQRHYPQQLSGGEMQRTAIARAVVHRPALLIADEPTGNLDSASGARVLDLLRDVHEETGIALLMATHAPDVARIASRVVHMRDGLIERIDAGVAV